MVTGRLVITITCAVQNDSDSGNANVDISVTHGAGVLTPNDGPAVRYTINDTGSGRLFAPSFAFEVDLGRVDTPVIFPVGTPVVINAIFDPNGQSVQWLDNGIQLTIEERPSL